MSNEKFFSFLLNNCGVRSKAKRTLEQFVHAFPQLLWSSDFLGLLLNVSTQLCESLKFDISGEVPSLSSFFFPLSPLSLYYAHQRLGVSSTTIHGDLKVLLPDSLNYRTELAQSYTAMCHSWLKEASTKAPKEVLSRLQVSLTLISTRN